MKRGALEKSLKCDRVTKAPPMKISIQLGDIDGKPRAVSKNNCSRQSWFVKYILAHLVSDGRFQLQLNSKRYFSSTWEEIANVPNKLYRRSVNGNRGRWTYFTMVPLPVARCAKRLLSLLYRKFHHHRRQQHRVVLSTSPIFLKFSKYEATFGNYP